MDIGIIAANITLSATSKGLSTCIMGSFNEGKIKEIFSIPDNIKVRLVIAVGYAQDDEFGEKTRKPFDEIVKFNSWE